MAEDGGLNSLSLSLSHANQERMRAFVVVQR